MPSIKYLSLPSLILQVLQGILLLVITLKPFTFLLTDSPVTPVALGNLWLVLHSPYINLNWNSTLSWSKSCLVFSSPFLSCSMFQDKHINLSNMPIEYLDLKRVFSKSRAASLLPLCPYDCAINLLLGTSSPKETFICFSPWKGGP